MSLADKIFVDMCKDIIENGTSTEGEKVRPVWPDGTSAYTIKKFGVVNRYDLSKEFPALTLRKTAIKTCVDEMLWIWQRYILVMQSWVKIHAFALYIAESKVGTHAKILVVHFIYLL